MVRHPAAEGAAHAGDIIPGMYGEQAEERAGPAQVPERVARRIAAQQARQGGGFLLHPRLRVPPERRRVLRHGLHGVERHEHVRLHRGDAALLALLQARRPETAECEAATGTGPDNRHRFAVPPTHNCDASGLLAAYSAPVPFTRDGIQFLAKDGNYELGVTPLCVMWKDPATSDFFLDENADGTDTQRVVLSLRGSTGDVVTGDPAPIALARLPAQFLESASAAAGGVDGTGDDGSGEGVATRRGGGGLKDGLLLRFAVGERGLQIQDGLPVAADLVYEGIANQRRGGADTMTKILFQYYARREPITVEEIGAAVESQAREAAMAASSGSSASSVSITRSAHSFSGIPNGLFDFNS